MPTNLAPLAEPWLPALVGGSELPTARNLSGSLDYFSAMSVRAAVEAAFQAELPRRSGRIWVAIDGPQLPYWGRG